MCFFSRGIGKQLIYITMWDVETRSECVKEMLNHRLPGAFSVALYH